VPTAATTAKSDTVTGRPAPAPAHQYDLDLRLLRHGDAFPQDDFYATLAPYARFKAGRGCGKTTTVCFDAVDYAEEYAKSYQLWTEPSWSQIERNALPALGKLYGGLKGNALDWNESPPIEITLANGSVIWLAAADTIDENRLRGMNLARLLMDEAASGHQEAAFHLASGCVRDIRYPNQRKFASTPQGRNWLWRIFDENPLPGAKTFIAYSQDAEDAGFVPQGWVEERALEYGGWDAPLARQELMAYELEMAGQVHPQFARSVHCRELDDRAIIRAAMRALAGGIDFGAVSPTAVNVMGKDGGGRAWAVDEWYKRNATLDTTAEAMMGFEGEYGRMAWYCDPSGKQQILALRSMGFDALPARHGNKIALRTQIVGRRLNVHPASKQPGLYLTSRAPNAIRETEALMWKRQRLAGQTEEMLRDEFDPMCDDHAYDAMTNVLAEWDVGRGPAPPRQREPILAYGALPHDRQESTIPRRR